MEKRPLDEYTRAKEPGMREKAYAWKTAIGLQKVDGLVTSDYLLETAKKNIEGEITLAESRRRIEGYYKSRPAKDAESDRVREADLVSQHIAEVLAEPTFSLTPASYVAIHRKLFRGVFSHAGRIRDYNITKAEWVLDDDTVRYESADVVAATLEWEFERERKFDYRGLSPQETVAHLARFVGDVWQIHAFGEGNTRTTSIFAIKYLRKLGFDVTNDVFADNAWYFRNALVRANYSNIPKGIHPTPVYLERFFENLLLGGKHALKSRFLHIGLPAPESALVPPKREQAGEQADKRAAVEKIRSAPSKQVVRLLKTLRKEMTVLEMMAALKLGGRRNFLEKYLSPALEAGFVEMSRPDSPRSPAQSYRLTEKGRELVAGKSKTPPQHPTTTGRDPTTTPHHNGADPTTTATVEKLAALLQDKELSASALRKALGLKDRTSFRDAYIVPAIKRGAIEMTHPETPNHRNQKYRLTAAWRARGKKK